MAHDHPTDGFEISETRSALPIALLRLRERLMSEFRPMLSEHGVTEQQWRVLRVLMESDALDAGELADRACILAPSLSRILKTLEAKGLINVSRQPGDARRSQIRLTDDGETFLRQATPDSARIYAGIEKRLGKDKIDALLKDLENALDALT